MWSRFSILFIEKKTWFEFSQECFCKIRKLRWKHVNTVNEQQSAYNGIVLILLNPPYFFQLSKS
jgi:hypothetical protein